MNESKKLESFTLVALLIGAFFHFSEKYFYIQSLQSFYGLGEFILVLGLGMLVYMLLKKRREEKS